MTIRAVLSSLLLVLAACAGPRPSGRDLPVVDVGTGNAVRPPTGLLVVHTDRVLSHKDDVSRHLHTPYDVYGPDGTYVLHVPNAQSFSDEAPTPVELPPGAYEVVTEHPPSRLRVTVLEGRLAEVDPRRAREEGTGPASTPQRE